MVKKKEKVAYGTLIGEPDWKEEVLMEGFTDKSNDDILLHLKKNYGNKYNRFRIYIVDLSIKPDFTKTVRKL